MVTCNHQRAPESRDGYYFEGTKVQKYLQKKARPPEKDKIALIKCQNFN